MQVVVIIPMVVVLCGIAFYVGWYLNTRSGQNRIMSADERAKKIIADAEREANSVMREKLLEVKDEWYKKKQEFDNDANQKRNKLQTHEKQLSSREENIDRKVELLNKKERELHQIQRESEEKGHALETRQVELDKMVAEEVTRLERASGLSREEAKKAIIENLTNSAKTEAAQALKEIRDRVRENAKMDAQKIIVQAIQRSAADHAVETTVSVLNIQSDEMKGRIIGREGRNIRAFEAATGVDVIVDDTPEAVILSGFDAFRREVARISLERA